jgi:siderophore synthetase component
MHRTRLGLTTAQAAQWAPECGGQVDLCFVALPRTALQVHGDWDRCFAGWAPAAPGDGMVVLPIHPGQWGHLHARVPEAVRLPETRPALAQASVRRYVSAS